MHTKSFTVTAQICNIM